MISLFQSFLLALLLSVSAVAEGNAIYDQESLESGSAVATQSEEGVETVGDDEEFNTGFLILGAVILSIIVATVMLLRQSKPGLPDDYGNGDDYDAGEDDPADHRR